MAGTVVTTEKKIGTVAKITFAWTTDGGTAAADATTTGTYDGEILGLATIPSAVTAPADNYDVTIKDSDGFDVLLGTGANRDEANTEYVDRASLAAVSTSKLTLGITNAGNAKLGTTVIWVR